MPRRKLDPQRDPLAPRSQRTLAEACRQAGLPEPVTARDVTEVCFRLLLDGIDHEHVGASHWRDWLLLGAPAEPARRAR